MVTIEPVAITAMQVDVVEAGSAVENAVVDDEALQVHDAHPLACLHRHAVDRHPRSMPTRHFGIQRGVAGAGRLADESALRPVPVDKDGDLQLGMRRPRGVDRLEHLAPGGIVLQVERCQDDPPARQCDVLEQRAAEVGRAGEGAHVGSRHRDSRQAGERQLPATAAQALHGRRQGRADGKLHGGGSARQRQRWQRRRPTVAAAAVELCRPRH
ncbi:MAG: hypothetical protein AW07_01944 [Candidatus Accumulibacter sp. SK-11]|nr:MAG: hypothetical protein AW07_01944 [Candidatus Accumulibacter sp. SK-11]